MRKRKAALAFSAGVMSVSTGAMGPQTHDRGNSISAASIDQRIPAALRNVSDEMKGAMIEEEGVRFTVYRDVAGYPTVGVGHLVTPEDGLSVGDRISSDQALDFLDADLKKAEMAVARITGPLPLYQHEFDALVDLAFNVGEGNLSVEKSPRLRRAIAAQDHGAIARELDYYHAGGEIAGGLINRSERRTRIFEMASYEDPREVDEPDQV